MYYRSALSPPTRPKATRLAEALGDIMVDGNVGGKFVFICVIFSQLHQFTANLTFATTNRQLCVCFITVGKGGVARARLMTWNKRRRRRRRRRRRLSLFVIVTNEDPPNAHQAQHRPVQATGAMSHRCDECVASVHA